MTWIAKRPFGHRVAYPNLIKINYNELKMKKKKNSYCSKNQKRLTLILKYKNESFKIITNYFYPIILAVLR